MTGYWTNDTRLFLSMHSMSLLTWHAANQALMRSFFA